MDDAVSEAAADLRSAPPLPEWGDCPPPLPVEEASALNLARPRARPVGEAERYVTLDVIRGVALCGILLVNIENFAMVRQARYDPALGGGDSGLDRLVWVVTYLFADTKFIAIFTILFGAGIAVANQRRRERGARGAWAVHVRRMIFLLVVGAAHGLFLWRGDILYFYAFWGLWLYFAPRLPALVLAVAGLGLYGLFAEVFSAQLLEGVEGYSWWERDIYQGGWPIQYDYRMQSEWYYLTGMPWQVLTLMVGLMLFGMALFKSGFLPGRWWTWVYFLGAAVFLGLGGWLVVRGTGMEAGFSGLFEAREFVWGSLLLTMGYLCAAIAATKASGSRSGVGGFAALGRMAFTNYLMQSVICTTIFYGYGLGWFERTTRVQQLGVVVAVCVFEMVFSVIWLRYFRFGPLEWVWRTFSYWRRQPLLRETVGAGDAGTTL